MAPIEASISSSIAAKWGFGRALASRPSAASFRSYFSTVSRSTCTGPCTV
jgi:hypothetical protein